MVGESLKKDGIVRKLKCDRLEGEVICHPAGALPRWDVYQGTPHPGRERFLLFS